MAKAPAASRRVLTPHPEWLLLGATAALVLFHYTTRADAVGVLGRDGRWSVLRALGLGRGRWRAGLAWLAVGIPLAVLAGWIGSRSPDVRAVYPLDAGLTAAPSAFIPHALQQFLYFGAWEVLFRGVLLFGLRDRLGGGTANLLQTALSVVAHFGRAFDETLAALPAGLLFGWVVGVSLDWFIVLGP